MAKLQWIGKARRTEPDGLYEIVVNQPGVGTSTLAVAQKVGAIAEGILAQNRDKGHARIEVEQRAKRVDAFVVLNDEAGAKAAAAIEFGHNNKRSGKHVEGVAPLRKAAGLI